MALGLDDKLLGEKVHNYCSSSEDEGEEDTGMEGREPVKPAGVPKFIPDAEAQDIVSKDYPGFSTNVRMSIHTFS